MIVRGMTPIHYRSDLNDWMECIIFVTDKDVNLAKLVIEIAIAEYWDGTYDTFGEAIKNYLGNNCVPFVIQYKPWDHENDCSDESYLIWDKWIDEIWSTTPGVTLS